jgi:hypothetical protein
MKKQALLQKAQALFEKVVDHIEGSPTPLVRYFYLFGAILAVRLSLEFFSSHRLFSLADVIHIGLWFAFIVLAFMLQLHLFSKVPIQKVAKLVVVCFTIALTAPIIDLIFTGGKGAKMNYLAVNNWMDFLNAYLTMGGASLSRGATLGIRIEIVLLVIASFNYVRTKTRSIVWALLGAWSIYTVLVFSGVIPKLLALLKDSLHLEYGANDQSTILLLLLVDLALLAVIAYRHAPHFFRKILRAIPWAAWLIGTICFVIGAGLARQDQPLNWVLDPTTLFWFPMLLGLSLILAAYAGLQRLVQAETMPSAKATLARNGLLVLILVLAYGIGERTLFVVAVLWGLLFLRGEAPLLLGNVPVLRTVLSAGVTFAAALAGYVTFGAPMVGFPSKWIWILLVIPCAAGIALDAGREGANIIKWFPDWSLQRQKIFRFIAAFLYLVGIGLVAWICKESLAWSILFCGLGLPASLILCFFPAHTKWLVWIQVPVFETLAYVVWTAI